MKFQPKPVKMTRFLREGFNVTIFSKGNYARFLFSQKVCLNCLGNSSMIARISHNFLQTFYFTHQTKKNICGFYFTSEIHCKEKLLKNYLKNHDGKKLSPFLISHFTV